jgi:cell division protein FtsW
LIFEGGFVSIFWLKEKFFRQKEFIVKRAKKQSTGRKLKADPVLFAVVIGLLVFGLVMITSIGVPKSIQLSAPGVLYPNCEDVGVDCYLLFKNHLARMIVGILMMFLMAKIPYQFWKKTASVWFIAAIAVLLVVLVLGSSYTTFARSWLVLFNTSFQPTEFAKLALVFYLASWMDRKKDAIQTFQNGFLPFCVICGVLLMPVLLQPDIGSTMVLAAIATTMYFVGGARIKHLAFGTFVVGIIVLLLASNISHIKQRVDAFLSSDVSCVEDYCWQSEQAKIAIGSGGFWGKGLTQGVQKSYWLPQATDDFIFAASAEELGFIRIGLLILAYAAIAWRGYLIAKGAPNRYVMLMATGLTSWIVFQAYVNIAVNLGLMPITGITLPFVSYGGSSMISVLVASGILLQLSKHSDYANSSSRRGDGRTYYS